MKPWTSAKYVLAIVLASLAGRAWAQEAAAPKTGIRAELIGQLDEAQSKLVELAQAMPADKYGWRPGPGVRSVSEVYMHVAGGNYMLLNFVGVKPPSGMSREMEKISDKAKVIENLKQSFEHVRRALINTPDADLDRGVKMFGQDTTVRGAYLLVVTHAHEHLGQAIAYARTNGIVPPWTAAEQTRRPSRQD
ncbi:MAG: DinB family protein [Acidobacteria bacterium]|nr:DinB family protein [Acidobacteriota bacterium]